MRKGYGSTLYLTAVKLGQDLGIDRIFAETASYKLMRIQRKLFGNQNNHYWTIGQIAETLDDMDEFAESLWDGEEVDVWSIVDKIDCSPFVREKITKDVIRAYRIRVSESIRLSA